MRCIIIFCGALFLLALIVPAGASQANNVPMRATDLPNPTVEIVHNTPVPQPTADPDISPYPPPPAPYPAPLTAPARRPKEKSRTKPKRSCITPAEQFVCAVVRAIEK